MRSSEKEFLEKIDKHKGIIFKISKMYMDNRDDQNDLFQELFIRFGSLSLVLKENQNSRLGFTESP